MGIEFSNNNRAKRATNDVKEYNLTYADNNSVVTIDSPTAKNVNVGNSLPPGFHCIVVQKGLGALNFIAGPGVNFLNAAPATINPGDTFLVISTDVSTFAIVQYGGGGGGGVTPTEWEALAEGSTQLDYPAGSWINGIVLQYTGAGTGLNFTIGTTPGGNEILADSIIPGSNYVFAFPYYLDISMTIYFTCEFTGQVKVFKQP